VGQVANLPRQDGIRPPDSASVQVRRTTTQTLLRAFSNYMLLHFS
jgi:hypothetical protein